MKKGFDNAKYLQMQSQHIRERIAQFDNKLYLEFGGKLFDDYHASRVLPGFEPDSKLQMLLQLKEQAEIVIVISAQDIISSKVRGDYGITYDLDVLRLIDAFQGMGLFVGSVCVTMYTAAPEVEAFEHKLNSVGVRTFRHYKIPAKGTGRFLNGMEQFLCRLFCSHKNLLLFFPVITCKKNLCSTQVPFTVKSYFTILTLITPSTALILATASSVTTESRSTKV